jgi:hypothetical protein
LETKHLYNSKLSKFRWFIARFGAKEILLKPLRTIFAPLIIPALPKRSFQFQGQTLDLLYHRYNMTWASERCVEVPIARYFLSKFAQGKVLEVGNVLSHYGPVRHDILDKFERGRRVINEDITTFRPSGKYGLIISISTFEHIGFDDEAVEPSRIKILAAIDACKCLLSDTGKLVVTAPIGYNPDLDLLLEDGKTQASRETYLKKDTALEWRELSKEEALRARYKKPFPYANAIVVLEFGGS